MFAYIISVASYHSVMNQPSKKLKMKENSVMPPGNSSEVPSSLNNPGADEQKHPVMQLQELYVPKGITPKYDLVESGPGANFTFQVSIGDLKATGCGQSKKMAKHMAAKTMLEKLPAGTGGFSIKQKPTESRGSQKAGKQNHPNVEKKLEEVKSKAQKMTTIYYPRSNKIQWTGDKRVLVVCFDVELAFGNEVSEIYQIGAIATNEDKILINILPEGNIHWGVVKYAGTFVSTEFDRTSRRKYLWNSKKQEELSPVVSPIQG